MLLSGALQTRRLMKITPPITSFTMNDESTSMLSLPSITTSTAVKEELVIFRTGMRESFSNNSRKEPDGSWRRDVNAGMRSKNVTISTEKLNCPHGRHFSASPTKRCKFLQQNPVGQRWVRRIYSELQVFLLWSSLILSLKHPLHTPSPNSDSAKTNLFFLFNYPPKKALTASPALQVFLHLIVFRADVSWCCDVMGREQKPRPLSVICIRDFFLLLLLKKERIYCW